jgi:hypothetical protein
MNANEIELNGKRYREVDFSGEKRMILVVDNRGLTFVGHVDLTKTDEFLPIRDARCMIRWGTSGHLAEIADGPKRNTKLGHTRDVIVRRDSIIAGYYCGEGWK